MWESIGLTLGATAGNNIGKVLQKKGTVILPPLSFKPKVIKAYAGNRTWLIGFIMDMAGALLMLKALSQAPVSVVQPVSGCGLAILSVFSHFYLNEMMNTIDWIGITLAGIGTIGVGAGGEDQEEYSISVMQLSLLGVFISIFFMDSEVVEEMVYGLESGVLFGLSSVISKMGFLLMEKGYPRIVVPVSIGMSMCSSAVGFYYQTRGLKQGRAIVVSTCCAVAAIVTGVLAGMLALGETLPSGSLARWSLLIGWLCIVVGVILLVVSNRLMRRVPRSWRRFFRAGGDRSGLTGNLRKETNPSAVVQAVTLHHMLSSSGKEKD